MDAHKSSISVFTDHSALYNPNTSNTKQDTYQTPFYCNFDFTCFFRMCKH